MKRAWLLISLTFSPTILASNEDIYWAGGAILWGTSVLAGPPIAASSPRWQLAPHTDLTIRDNLRWQDMQAASNASDALLWGLAMPSVLWAPAFSNKPYSTGFRLMTRTMILNGLLTQGLKLGFARERPYAHFDTRPSKGYDDNLSFVSGHSSFAFAMFFNASHLLEQRYPENATLIKLTAALLASSTAYFRVAGDKHYLTDVTAGAAVGLLSAWLVRKNFGSGTGPSISKNQVNIRLLNRSF
jgi:membrane-associated phospholipid phosphatase